MATHKKNGVFHRLDLSIAWQKSVVNSSQTENSDLQKELRYFCPAECARYSVKYLESLDYYMLDMKNSCLVRYRSCTASSSSYDNDIVDDSSSSGSSSDSGSGGGQGLVQTTSATSEEALAVCVDCTGASLSWTVIQVVFAILTNNTTVFVVPDPQVRELLRRSVAGLEAAAAAGSQEAQEECAGEIGVTGRKDDKEENNNYAIPPPHSHSSIPISFAAPSFATSTCTTHETKAKKAGKEEEQRNIFFSFRYKYTPLQHDVSTGQVVVPSILPSLDQLLRREVQTLPYLQHKYGAHVTALTDEFDLLPDGERDGFVQERSRHLLARVRESSDYYARTLSSNWLSRAPLISGQTLLQHVAPYGQALLSSSAAVQVPSGHDSYAVAFASGGSTGRMKFVYRSEWEDQENARYLGKGLYAGGIRQSDVVVNTLSAGFWGGMHVFNLALSYTGCAVIPLGPAFSLPEVVTFLRQLRPTAVLGMPSFVMALADHVATQQQQQQRQGAQKLTGTETVEEATVVIRKVITGGEMMLPEMENRIRSILHVEEFLSTGYTSNETGAIGFRCPHLPADHFHVHENMQHVCLSPLVRAEEQEQEQQQQQQGQLQETLSPPPPSPAAAVVKAGETGRIVATNLNRTLMPLLHYEVGDMGCFVPRGGGDAVSGACGCGRRLRVLRLLGRCDCRIRLGAEDLLFLEEIPRCLQAANTALSALSHSSHVTLSAPPPVLTLLSVGCFSLEVTKSARQFDHLTLHVEVSSSTSSQSQSQQRDKNGDSAGERRERRAMRRVKRAVLLALGQHTQLVWEVQHQRVAAAGGSNSSRSNSSSDSGSNSSGSNSSGSNSSGSNSSGSGSKRDHDELEGEREEEEEDMGVGGGGDRDSDSDDDDDVMFVHMMTKKRKLSEACIEVPAVVLHAPGTLPRHPRTGKIVLLVDKR